MDGAAFFIEQQRKQHVSRLNSWANQVRGSRTAAAALRTALTLEPSPHPLIRGMKSIYGADQTRAKRAIEIRLVQHLNSLTRQSDISECLPLARRITWATQVTEWAVKASRLRASAASEAKG